MQKELINAAYAAQMAGVWLDRNRGLEPDLNDMAPQLIADLARAANSAENNSFNIKPNSTVAVFGPSQAGKSYLISAMAADENGQLLTHWDDMEINFITHLNPPGGDKEATGMVTRLTRCKSDCPKNFPVKLKVFKEIELAMILLNTYYNDLKPSEIRPVTDRSIYVKHLHALNSYVDQKARELFRSYPAETLQELDTGDADGMVMNLSAINSFDVLRGRKVTINGNTEFNYISPDDVVDLADYVKDNSGGKIEGWDEMQDFWELLRDMLPFMNLEGRIRALSILWNNSEVFNETFRKLASTLLTFEGHTSVYAPRESCIVKNEEGEWDQRSDGTIIDVTKINMIFKTAEPLTCALAAPRKGVADDSNDDREVAKEVSVNTYLLGTLSYEMVFILEGSSKLDAFDILDLPGARSRLEATLKKIEDDCRPLIQDYDSADHSGAEVAFQFLVRGKVAYLFDRYSKNREMDQLLLCIPASNQPNVNELNTIMNSWVANNVGATAELRHNFNYNPLTVACTRFDNYLITQFNNIRNGIPVNITNATSKTLDFLKMSSWFLNWDSGKCFNRVFLVRKPRLGKESNAWFEYADDGRTELKIIDNDVDKIDKIKKSILECPDFINAIGPDKIDTVVENFLAVNNGGASLIADSIKSNALDQKKRTELRADGVKSDLQSVISRLSLFARREGAEALEKAAVESRKVALGLMQCNLIYPCFGPMRSLLELDSDTIEKCYRKLNGTGSRVDGFIQAVSRAYLENLNSLCRKGNQRLANLVYLICDNYEKRELQLFSDYEDEYREAFSFCWNETEKRFKTVDEFRNDVFALFNSIFNEIGKAFNSQQVRIRYYMYEKLKDAENSAYKGDVDMRLMSNVMSSILSDFNLYLGTNMLPDDEEKERYTSKVAPNLGKSKAMERQELAKFAAAQADRSGILGRDNGPVNSYVLYQNHVSSESYKNEHDVFCQQVAVDENWPLPVLTKESTGNYEFRLISDFVSVLTYMMCNVNIHSESKYQFSSEENRLLCRILSTMERCA
ncbi:virulence factor SrfC family protein [Anaerobiospirillum sp. NML120449]|uniref:virulence factor SrfC family protein n=1 Tax=Anaerobiospirillum sp. NML120449 TaxID=2932817 RepID=UPI001FF2DCA0|nr:virulence factor SrfC family protein [Anaerobiospirillum sp. NML120449]MCK0525923.1 putative virulence factor [Anaerobiospirillum sp. NML120449]